MKLCVTELKKYYSSKAVRLTYICVMALSLIFEYLFGIDKRYFILIPALAVQSHFGSVFGIITVFLVGKIWENDLLDGVVKNIFSAGISRGKWFISKLELMFVHCLAFTGLFYVSGLILGIIKGCRLQEFNMNDLVVKNIQSSLAVLLIALVYGALASLVFLLFKNFKIALLATMVGVLLECAVSVMKLVENKLVFLPYAFMVNLIVSNEENDSYTFDELFIRGIGSMLLILTITEAVAFVRCLKRDY